MENKELLQIIKQAARDRATSLKLRDEGLTALLAEIGQLAYLEWLYLDGNRLAALPPEIGQLTKLARLYLDGNRLAALPPEIGQLTKLTRLDLSSNQLAALPAEIGQLVNLKKLHLGYNGLAALPAEIGQLVKLKELDLNSNQLMALPAEIGQLTNLARLDLDGNQLTVLPAEIGQLPNLTWLYLGGNQLTALPAGIGQLTNLTRLDLGGNRLTALPAEIGQLSNLKELYLDANQLTALPSEIGQLINLTVLDLRDNLLPIPPEILEKPDEPAAIINYYLQHLADQKRPLNEVKLLLVGQGGVGKTSLVRRLVEGRFDPYENKTEGIDIRRWQIMVPDAPPSVPPARRGEVEIRLNVWDFGGQEIMHATHQFFLTRRSLYLLVLDARLGEEENRVEYWLKMIQSFGGESPVIVVGNKIDQQPLDIDRRGLQAKYHNIKAIVETSCLTGQGIDELKAVIAREVGALPHVHDQLLNTWFAVKGRLEHMEQDYIPYTEYVRICQAEGVDDEISQRTLIGFLHDLGVVLNFRDDPRLEDTNILNPEWVTNGVYKILNSKALFEGKGILERRMLSRILDSREYPRHKHLFIVDMMRKFELCFDFEGLRDRKFLVPDLLAKEEPDTGDWSGALAFQYHYSVLPGSVISRFIVRMNHYVHRHTYWRSGVVLTHDGNKALVKADKEDRKIFIWIDGPERARRTLLAIIRSQFEAIHKTITGLEVEEKVPLPGHPELPPVDYGYLRDLEEMGETTFIPPGLRERVNVKQLLDGVDEPKGNRRARLLKTLTERFDEDELRTLCFHLETPYDDLPGKGKAGKARELVTYLERRGRLSELATVGKRLRPDIPWGDVL